MQINDMRKVNFIEPVDYPALKDSYQYYETFTWDDTQEYNQWLRFMWAYNDYNHRNKDTNIQPTSEDKANFLSNTLALERFFDPLSFAEFLRQASAFDQCIAAIKNLQPDMLHNAKPFAEHVLKLAEQGINAPFNLEEVYENG